MNPFDIEELRYTVAEHRQWLNAEIRASRSIQKWVLAQVGYLLAWLGFQFIAWGNALQSISAKSQVKLASGSTVLHFRGPYTD
jgi:N-acetyl-beta-hexosaminidase